MCIYIYIYMLAFVKKTIDRYESAYMRFEFQFATHTKGAALSRFLGSRHTLVDPEKRNLREVLVLLFKKWINCHKVIVWNTAKCALEQRYIPCDPIFSTLEAFYLKKYVVHFFKVFILRMTFILNYWEQLILTSHI